MAPYRGGYKNGISVVVSTLNKEELLEKYLKEFRVEQCPLFLQHKCQQHRPFTCFNWHFQNQRRRRPVRRRDGTFSYSADVYCSKYDETTGLCPDGDDCPFLHRTAGDTERRYHLKYYKTGMCVHDTDNRGYCVKNGSHCAFAHGAGDLRPPVYDIRELQAIEHGEADTVTGLNSLDKERNLLNDDPKWLDTTYVLANYKTEPCKKPPRLCRQGYACPQFHNNKDKRRSPKKFKYRSTPCPQVKTGDEWGDPVACDAGDSCQYCHTRTEQQFHPEIYKSTKCNDIQNTSYCPRGAFCAFAHIEQETVSLDSPTPENGHNLGEILSHVLPDQSKTRNEAELPNGLCFSQQRLPGNQRRNGSITPPFEENGVTSPMDSNNGNSSQQQQQQPRTSINGSSNVDHVQQQQQAAAVAAVTAAAFAAKGRFLTGDLNGREAMLRRQVFSIDNDPSLSQAEKNQRKTSLLVEVTKAAAAATATSAVSATNGNAAAASFASSLGLFPAFESPMDSLGSALDDLGLDAFSEGLSKSRKSSGFSETHSGNGTSKSRQGSGYEQQQQQQQQQQQSGSKSRNCSGGSTISQGLVSSGILPPPTNPVGIPGAAPGSASPGAGSGGSPTAQQHLQLQQMLQQQRHLENGHETATNSLLGMNQLGLFDLTTSPKSSEMANKDLEIARLKEELSHARSRLNSWDESYAQARSACEAWKKETAISTKKAELALREKDGALAQLAQLQKEMESAGPYVHGVRRVAELKTMPVGVLKTIEWQLRKDLFEVEKALRQHTSDSLWPSPPSSNGVSVNNAAVPPPRLFDFGGNFGADWATPPGTQQPQLFGPLV